MWPMSAQEVVNACGGECSNLKLKDLEIYGATNDSRIIKKNELYVAIKGDNFDGHKFILEVLKVENVFALVEQKWSGYQDLSDAFKARCIKVENVLTGFRNLAKEFRSLLGKNNCVVFGIGGSNGKTTTKEMLSAMLAGKTSQKDSIDGYSDEKNRVNRAENVSRTEKSQNGYLGVALTLCKREHAGSSKIHSLVLEIGIDETGAMESHVAICKPDIVLLTAMGPEHLAGLGTWENGQEEEYKLFIKGNPLKARIWQLDDEYLWNKRPDICSLSESFKLPRPAARGDSWVLNIQNLAAFEQIASGKNAAEFIDSKYNQLNKECAHLVYQVVKNSAESSTVRLVWKSQVSKNAARNLSEIDFQNRPFDLIVPLPGLHNVQNFALACAAALSSGLTIDELKNGWDTFVPPEMRSKVTKILNGITLYDDCYNASPSSMEAGLASLAVPEWELLPKLVVLGDMLDLGVESKKWHLLLIDSVAKLKNTDLCLYGDAMKDVYEALKNRHGTIESKFRSLVWKSRAENPAEFASLLGDNSLVFVKGSRGMDLGRVVSAVSTLKR